MNAADLLERAKTAVRPTVTPRYNLVQFLDVFRTLRSKHWSWKQIHGFMVAEGVEVHKSPNQFAAAACHVLKRDDERKAKEARP